MSHKALLINQSEQDPISYGRILDFQRGWSMALAGGHLPYLVWIGSHSPVVTLGRSANESELFVSPEELRKKGVELHSIERGGLATVHGPGQLVSYPIVNVRDLRLGVKTFVSCLERVMIDTLKGLGIAAGVDDRNHGVWVGNNKIGFIGLALKHHVSYHGLSLNVILDPTLFNLISPCGLEGINITSAEKLLNKPVDLAGTGRLLAQAMADHLDLSFEPITLEDAEERLKSVPTKA